MVLPNPPLNPTQPIPNSPFFYPQQDSLTTGSGAPLIVGSGICINYATSVITAISGCGIPCNLILSRGDLIGGGGPSLPQRVALGTNGQVLTVNTACPQGLQWTFACGIPPSIITCKGDLIAGTAASTAAALPVGPYGYILTADTSTTTGLAWKCNTAIPCGLVNKGGLITGSSPGVPFIFPAGTNGQYLTADSTAIPGLRWVTLPSYVRTCCYTGKGYILAGCAANCPTPLVPGAAGQFLRTNPVTATGLEWYTCESIPCSCLSGSVGRLIVGCSTTFGPLNAGANGQYLAVDLSCALGLKWCTPAFLPCNFLTQKGQIIAAANGGVPTALNAGADGTILTVDFTCTTGIKWVAPNTIPCALIQNKGSLAVGCGAGGPTALPAGASGYILSVDSSQPSGLRWCFADYIPCSFYAGQKGAIPVGSVIGGTFILGTLSPGSDGQLLVSCSTTTDGYDWITLNPKINCTPYCNNKGAIPVGTVGSIGTLSPGSNGQLLVSCDSTATGYVWCTGTGISRNCITGKGALITGTAPSTPVALPVGPNGSALVADNTCPSGLKWSQAIDVCTTCGVRSFGPVYANSYYEVNVTCTPIEGLICGVYNFQVWGHYYQPAPTTPAACGWFRLALYNPDGSVYGCNNVCQFFATGQVGTAINYGLVPISMNWIYDAPQGTCLYVQVCSCIGSGPAMGEVVNISSLFDNFYK